MVGPVEVGLDEVEGLEQLQLAGEGVRTRARGIGLSGSTRTEGLGWRGRRAGMRGRAGTCRDGVLCGACGAVLRWGVVWCLRCGVEMGCCVVLAVRCWDGLLCGACGAVLRWGVVWRLRCGAEMGCCVVLAVRCWDGVLCGACGAVLGWAWVWWRWGGH
jgi:hypothetical protein